MSSNDSLKARLRAADAAERKVIIDNLPYDVGFAKPPKQMQFSSSRQPARRKRRRPRPTGNELLDKELAKRIEVVEGDRAVRCSKEEVIYMQLVNKAAAGDDKAQKRLFDLRRQQNSLQTVADDAPTQIDVKEARAKLRATMMRLIDIAQSERSKKA